MAGNKNPWRDILMESEWSQLIATAERGALKAVGLPDRFRAQNQGKQQLHEIGQRISQYHAIPKDDCTRFTERSGALVAIASLCVDYGDFHDVNRQKGQKSGAREAGDADPGHRHKQLTDGIDVWVRSLASRALKKSEYLEVMAKWHLTAKEKFQNAPDLVEFLWDLDQDNVRGANREFLHSTPYATIEKIDPYHRETVFLMGQALNDEPRPHRGEMANAFRDYAMGRPPRLPDPRTHPHASTSFYEWLEYHPICFGTPGVQGDARYKNLHRISYAVGDLAIATPTTGRLEYVRVSDVGTGRPARVLETSTFPPSSKGHAHAVAFVWARNKSLLLHEHGDGFVHASAEQGHKVRCSGMLVSRAGVVVHVADQSGHYAPTQQHIHNFLGWLHSENCLAASAMVEFEVNGSVLAKGTYAASDFMQAARSQHGAAFLL
jgi:hypothetical protein